MIVSLTEASIGQNLATALSSTKLWTNICSTIIFIALGFFFTKKKLLPDNTGKVLTKFVMGVCLPCLAFTSFITDFTVQGGVDAVVNFLLGFVLYILFIFLGKLIFIWVKDPTKRMVLSVLFAFGSTTFFGLPLVSALYKDGTCVIDFNLMNVAYRVFLYSYAYVTVAGIKVGQDEKTSMSAILKKVFLNPIVIATFVGLFLWLLQAIPGVNCIRTDWLTTNKSTTYVAPWRFDVTLPWIHSALKTLGSLSSTIILFAIGCTLGGTSIKDAAKDKYAWIWTGLKVIAAPVIVLAILFAVEAIAKACGYPQLISVDTLRSSVFTWMVPPATVAVGYCINFDKEKEMASHLSLIGTLGSVVGIIIWVIVLTVIDSSGFFFAA